MAIYRTLDISTEQKAANTASVRATLLEMGAVLSESFESIGTPIVHFGDGTNTNDEKNFDFSPFKGRLVLGGKLYNENHQHTPGGPVRITISRWGTEPNQCGRVIVGKSDLNSTSIVSYESVTIGDNVHFEPRVVIMDSPGHPIDRRLPDITENRTMKPIVIHDNAWIGYGATILPGVTIGKNAVIKPGAVVMWDVPENGIVCGNPAKSIKVYKKYFGESAEKEG